MYMGGLYLGRNEKKAVFSFCLSPAIYNGWATWRKEFKQGKGSYLLLSMKKDQANKTNVEGVYRWWPLAWEPGPNGSSVDLWLVREWVQCSHMSCASMHQSWSRAEAEEAEWRQRQSEVARGGWRRGREVIP